MKNILTSLVVCLAVSPAILRASEADELAFFESKVRPILVEQCYSCHSKDAKKVRGELLLDSKDAWMKGGESGQVIIPGQPEKSLLVGVLSYKGAIQMPPKGKLPEKDIAILTEWVKRGAYDPRKGGAPTPVARKIDFEAGKNYWAWQPLKSPPLPKVQDAKWCRTPVDFFLKQAMDSKGVSPNPMAEKRKLIRRAYLDLIGLPPSPEAIDKFVKDEKGDAWARVVEGLLKSPQYGERWGRHWLDVARFAESHGYEQDYDRPNAYHYRDFVIKALNQDLPYDKFVKWQLAGDEYEPDNALALMATGFLAAGTHATQITANQAEKERYDELDDMVRTIGATMLGLTIACARCHDHKFDPISSNDYYRLISTFSTTVRSDYDIPLDSPTYTRDKATFEEKRKAAEAKRNQWEKDTLPGRVADWVKAGAKDAPQGEFLIPEIISATAKNGTSLNLVGNGVITASGTNPDFETYTIQLKSTTSKVAFVRLEALSDKSLVKGGPGRAPNGNFALSDFKATVNPVDASGKAAQPKPVKFKAVRSSFDQKGLPASATIDADKKSSWAVDPQFGKDHAAVFALENPIDLPHGGIWSFVLDFNGNNKHNLAKIRLTLSTEANPTLASAPLPEKARFALERLKHGDKLPPEQLSDLANWYKTRDEDWKKLNRAVEEVLQTEPKPKLVKALISSEGVPAVRNHTQGADFYDPVHLLKRGDLNQKVSPATQGFPVVLMKSKDGEKHWQSAPPKDSKLSYRRRNLAEWITDTEQGAGMLLARVIVNRVWYHHFGRGIVATPSDFGIQGEKPSNPELLDWLASNFVQSGWKLKELHKLIMTSSAYTQSAFVDEQRLLKDRDNSLVWHYQTRRLEGEVIRDSMLGVSGLLDETQFGPGSLDPNQKRRSIYYFIKRSRLVPMMMLFDGPDTLQDLATRPNTTIAPQALMMMNSTVVRGYAEGLAARVRKDFPSESAGQVRQAYLLALGRHPKSVELKEGLEFLKEQEAFYLSEKKVPSAGLADFCQALFSLNEFVFIE